MDSRVPAQPLLPAALPQLTLAAMPLFQSFFLPSVEIYCSPTRGRYNCGDVLGTRFLRHTYRRPGLRWAAARRFLGVAGLLMNAPDTNITQLLRASASGDRRDLDALMSAIYGDLRRLAISHMQSERDDHTLQPTA